MNVDLFINECIQNQYVSKAPIVLKEIIHGA